MDIKLATFRPNGNNGAGYISNERVTAGNGDGAANSIPDATENEGLLSVQSSGCNGEAMPSGYAADAHRDLGNVYTPQEMSSVCRVKRELSEVVFWRIRLWMIIVVIFFLIIAVILISLIVCSLIHEDVDENFDRSLFKVPQYFNGSFQLPYLIFGEELFTLSSNESQALAADLQEKVCTNSDLYF